MNFSTALKLSRFNKNRIAFAQSLIAQVPEGKALLDLAAEKGCTFKCNMTFLMSIEIGARFERTEPPAIVLHPLLSTKTIVKLLCHELRHLWQFEQLKDASKLADLSRENSIGFTRLIEGDAFVFENIMAAKISKATGIPIPVHDSPDAGTRLFRTCKNLFRKPSPLPDERELFINFQDSHLAFSYDEDVMLAFAYAAEKKDKGYLEKPADTLKSLGGMDKITITANGKNYLSADDLNILLHRSALSAHN